METLFSSEMLRNCVAPVNEVNKAKQHGKLIVSENIDGKVTAYLWQDKMYVVSVEIKSESIRGES